MLFQISKKRKQDRRHYLVAQEGSDTAAQISSVPSQTGHKREVFAEIGGVVEERDHYVTPDRELNHIL